MYLESNFCRTARGQFEMARNYDGSQLDKELFTFSTGFADDFTPVANLTIHTTQRKHVGNFKLLIKETS